jgi:signal transduction histidine kinase
MDNQISQKASGSGLGLFIASQILEKNGGHISVTSKQGVGSCFSIHLPATLGQNQQEGRRITAFGNQPD